MKYKLLLLKYSNSKTIADCIAEILKNRKFTKFIF